jgi:acetylglutamate kinase
LIVIKYGGHAMKDESGTFAQAIAIAISQGLDLIIVHGGGPQIDAALVSAGIESQSIGGFRVTTPEIFEIVQSVLAGEVCANVVSSLRKAGVNAAGISGRDGNTLQGIRMTKIVDGTPAELGLVGEVTKVDTQLIESLLEEKFTPVISPLANEIDSDNGLNVNADLAAASIAGGLNAESLIVLTDVAGIYRDYPDPNSIITEISVTELTEMRNDFQGGMAPKVAACLAAIKAGAKTVRIIDGNKSENLLLALAGQGGTLVHS